MTLEVLFAREAQDEAFLLLVGGGVLLCGLIHLSGLLHHRHPFFGMAADLCCAALLVMLLLGVALWTGAELRLYALLGLCVGAALYLTGLRPLVHLLAKPFHTKSH